MSGEFAPPPWMEEWRDRLAGVRSLVVMTGAGMSAESGVATFRGPGGLWEGHRPEELATPEAFARDPERVWRWYRWRHAQVSAARPHAGHRALAHLERHGAFDAFAVVTQNVDGLHQRAGSTRVIELHGSIRRARCDARCGETRPLEAAVGNRPLCPCGEALLRPDVVWFGESLPGEALEEAWSLLQRVDMAWVVGTSAVVYPAAALPRLALERGLLVVEVNPEPTPLSPDLRYTLRAPAATGLPLLAGALFAARGIPAPSFAVEEESREGPGRDFSL